MIAQVQSVLQIAAVTAWVSTAFGQAAIQQPAGGTIKGSVFRADVGKPARFANVILHSTEAAESEAKSKETTDRITVTDLNGNFLFENVAAGRYGLIAWMQGYRSPLSKIDPSGSDQRTLESRAKTILVPVEVTNGIITQAVVPLDIGSELDGRVLFDDGNPSQVGQGEGGLNLYRFCNSKPYVSLIYASTK